MNVPSLRTPPRPVLLYGMATAAVSAFLGFAGVGDLMPKVVIAWVALAWAVIGGAWAVYVQSVVTPLSDPADRDGTPLVRLPDAATIEAAVAERMARQNPTPPVVRPVRRDGDGPDGLGWTKIPIDSPEL